ncbi:hypothetical protein M885DRAFT_625996 [Pelagophyceae sp. CCMP2097]|nr:hypothetical protein M885DRAFT_625996 [Pelagophyceae sp. CCMP2097]
MPDGATVTLWHIERPAPEAVEEKDAATPRQWKDCRPRSASDVVIEVQVAEPAPPPGAPRIAAAPPAAPPHTAVAPPHSHEKRAIGPSVAARRNALASEQRQLPAAPMASPTLMNRRALHSVSARSAALREAQMLRQLPAAPMASPTLTPRRGLPSVSERSAAFRAPQASPEPTGAAPRTAPETAGTAETTKAPQAAPEPAGAAETESGAAGHVIDFECMRGHFEVHDFHVESCPTDDEAEPRRAAATRPPGDAAAAGGPSLAGWMLQMLLGGAGSASPEGAAPLASTRSARAAERLRRRAPAAAVCDVCGLPAGGGSDHARCRRCASCNRRLGGVQCGTLPGGLVIFCDEIGGTRYSCLERARVRARFGVLAAARGGETERLSAADVVGVADAKRRAVADLGTDLERIAAAQMPTCAKCGGLFGAGEEMTVVGAVKAHVRCPDTARARLLSPAAAVDCAPRRLVLKLDVAGRTAGLTFFLAKLPGTTRATPQHGTVVYAPDPMCKAPGTRRCDVKRHDDVAVRVVGEAGADVAAPARPTAVAPGLIRAAFRWHEAGLSWSLLCDLRVGNETIAAATTLFHVCKLE